MLNSANNDKKVKVNFEYITDYGEVCSLHREVSCDYLGMSELGIMCELFKDFLYACGFTFVANKEIALMDEE